MINLSKVQSLIQKFDNREIENLERKGRAKKQPIFSAKKETISTSSKGIVLHL
jgi:hypothetical protein